MVVAACSRDRVGRFGPDALRAARVPARPASASPSAAAEVISASPPVRDEARQRASTFGRIEPCRETRGACASASAGRSSRSSSACGRPEAAHDRRAPPSGSRAGFGAERRARAGPTRDPCRSPRRCRRSRPSRRDDRDPAAAARRPRSLPVVAAGAASRRARPPRAARARARRGASRGPASSATLPAALRSSRVVRALAS